MNYILFDGEERSHLLPFTFTRPCAEIRIGILTIKEKWELYLSQSVSYKTQLHLSEKFPMHTENENILINGCVLPDANLVEAISNLKENQKLIWHGV